MTTTTTEPTESTKFSVPVFSTDAEMREIQFAGLAADYDAADKAEKAKIRTAVNEALMDAVRNLDMDQAKACQELGESLKSIKAPATPADPNLVLATRIATLKLAAEALITGHVVPSGMDSETIDYAAVEAMVKSQMDSDDHTEASIALASAKITRRASSGDRRDIGAWIERAADTMTDGQFATISQIVNLGVTDDESDSYRPSSGAVAARLYPAKGECTLDLHSIGIELAVNDKGVKGIRRVSL